jgi:SOS-response transcriptional repressor LexA
MTSIAPRKDWPLSERERAIVIFIGRNQPTTHREIGAAVGLRSSGTVWSYIRKLSRLGIITKDALRSRSIRLHDDIFISEKGQLCWLAQDFREVLHGSGVRATAT